MNQTRGRSNVYSIVYQNVKYHSDSRTEDNVRSNYDIPLDANNIDLC